MIGKASVIVTEITDDRSRLLGPILSDSLSSFSAKEGSI